MNHGHSGRDRIFRNHAHSLHGLRPDWVDRWDELARWDRDKQTVYCKVCDRELKNVLWAQEHAERHGMV